MLLSDYANYQPPKVNKPYILEMKIFLFIFQHKFLNLRLNERTYYSNIFSTDIVSEVCSMAFFKTIKREPYVTRLSIKHLAGDIILLYRLTEEKLSYGSSLYSTVFSISVTKIDCGGRRREVSRVCDISRNEAEALKIFRLISRGRVTPCCLHEIMEDILS